MFIMDFIHPGIYKWIQWIPEKIGFVILVIFLSGFLADLDVTVNTVLKLNKKLQSLEKTAEAMRKLSDEIGEDIFEKMVNVADKKDEVEDFIAEKRLEVEEKKLELKSLTEEYERMLRQKQFGFKRLTKAFPGMKSLKQNDILQQYKKILDEIRK